MIRLLKYNPKLTITIIVLIIGLGAAAVLPVSIMEARNFVTAREMLNDGNWLLTTMNGEARYEKPPLPTWLSAVSASIFGISAFSMRLPALLMVIVLGIYCYKISSLLNDDYRLGFLAGIIAVTSFYVLAIVIEAPWDIYAHTFMLLAIYYGLKFIKQHKSIGPTLIVIIVFAAAAFLSKGPIAYYALFLPFLLSLFITYGSRFSKKRIFGFFLIVLIGLALGSLWYIYVRLEDPETFEAIASKETSNWSSYNVRPFYYYWSFFVQSGIWAVLALVSLLLPYLAKKVKHPRYYKFTWWWTVLAVILLSIIPEKKSRYLMPVLIPLALTLSNYLLYVIEHSQRLKQIEKLPLFLHFGILALVGLGLPVGIWFFLDLKSIHIILLTSISVGIFLIGLALSFNLFKFNLKRLTLLSVALMIIAVSSTLLLSDQNSSIRTAINDFKNLGLSDKKVYGIAPLSPEFVWYFGEKIPVLEVDSLNSHLKGKEGFIITEYRNDLGKDSLSDRFNIKLLESYDFNMNTDTSSSSYKNRLKAGLYSISQR